MSLCPSDGNQGFPVVLDGSINTVNDMAYKEIQSAPEIYSAFGHSDDFAGITNQLQNETQSRRRNVLVHPNMYSNTLNYKGANYSLKHIQICQKTQSGSWPTAPKGTNRADCVFSFKGTRGLSEGSPSSIILIVPLHDKESMQYEYDVSKRPLMYFQDVMVAYNKRPAKPRVPSLGQIFSGLGDKGYALYSTCLMVRLSPTYVKTINVLGLYFPFGWILPSDLINQLGDYSYNGENRFGPLLIPSELRYQGAPIAKRPITTLNPDAPAIQAYISNGDSWSTDGQTYPKIISPSDDAFRKRLLFVAEGLTGIGREGHNNSQNRLKTTFEYQCLPLDKARDINGQYVMLDPKTGARTLSDTLKGTEEQKIDIDMAIKVDSSGAIEKFAITAGIFTAIAIIVIAFSFVVRYIMNRQGTVDGAAAAKAIIQDAAVVSAK